MAGDRNWGVDRQTTRSYMLLFIVVVTLVPSWGRAGPAMYGVIRNVDGTRGWSQYYEGLERLGYQTPSTRRASPAPCETDLHWRRLCVQCAKITKSPWAFPLCCNRDLSAPQFCTNLVQYGMP